MARLRHGGDGSSMSMLTITETDLRRFAPKAKPEYVAALLGNVYQLRISGILDNSYRLCHFMAQCAHETGGFTIVRESLHYTTAARIREVWPSRFRDKSDGELAALVKNERKLADAVYFGRMGNVQAGDAYDFRGGGFLQTTGRAAVTKYSKALGLEVASSLLDDPGTTLQFACLEWSESKCNVYADENDLTKVSKAINTGSAAGNVKPVDVSKRQQWFAKAWAIWGEKGKPDVPAEKSNIGFLKLGGGALGAVELTRQVSPYIPPVPPSVTESITNFSAWKQALVQLGTLSNEAMISGGAGLTVAAGAYAAARKWMGGT